MSDFSALLKRMEDQRATWVDLGEGRAARIVRPRELEMTERITIDDAVRFTVDWRGFTEATILGPSQGGDTVVPFNREVWHAFLMDHGTEAKAVVNGIKDAVETYLSRRAETAKNSEPSSI